MWTPLFSLRACIIGSRACPLLSVFQTSWGWSWGLSTRVWSAECVQLRLLCWLRSGSADHRGPTHSKRLNFVHSFSPLALNKPYVTWAWCAYCLFSVTLFLHLTLAAKRGHLVNGETGYLQEIERKWPQKKVVAWESEARYWIERIFENMAHTHWRKLRSSHRIKGRFFPLIYSLFGVIMGFKYAFVVKLSGYLWLSEIAKWFTIFDRLMNASA